MKQKIAYYTGWFLLIVFALVISDILTDAFWLWEHNNENLLKLYQSIGLMDGEYRLTK